MTLRRMGCAEGRPAAGLAVGVKRMETRPEDEGVVDRLKDRVAELEDLLRGSGRLTSLRDSLDDIFEGIQILDREWRYLYLNNTAAGHGRREREALLGRRIQDVYPDVVGTPLFERMRRALEARVPDQFLSEFTYPDGTKAWFDLRLRPVPRGLLVLSVDVTEQVRIRDELAQSRDRLSLTLACLTEAVVTTDGTGRIERVNPAAERLLGCRAEEARGRRLNEFARFVRRRSDAPLDPPIPILLRSTQPWTAPEDACLVTPTGRTVPVGVSGAALRDAGGQALGCVLVLHDRSQEHEMMELLHHAQKMEAVGRLAGGIAHDFNNLLTIVTGSADLLLSGVIPPEELRPTLQQIAAAGRRGAALTRQLLLFSRRQPVDRERLDLGAVIAEAEPMLRRLLGETIEIEMRLARGLPAVWIHRGHVDQVVMNLAVNARDAMPQGGRLTVHVGAETLDAEQAAAYPEAQPGDHVAIAVTDTGTGMDEATRRRIFEPYFTTKGPGRGTGLGLSTVYGIVRQHGGSVRVHSEVGRGSTFEILLPVARADEGTAWGPPAARAHPPTAAPRSERDHTVLVVEDAEPVREFLGVVLGRAGYRTLTAASVAEALDLSRTTPGPIHLLLTDLVLPDDSGSTLARRLQAERPELKVAYMSGYTDEAAVRQGDIPPGSVFFEKPVLPTVLFPRLRALLDGA